MLLNCSRILYNTISGRYKMILNKLIGTRQFYKKVMLLVLPIMLQNGVTNLVNMIDNVMVGSVGTEQMSAVAIVNQLLFVFNLAIFGITSGIGIFTAQYFGKGDKNGLRDTFRLKLVSAITLLFAALLIFQFFGSSLINSYLHEGSEPMDLDLAFREAKNYMSIMLIGLVPMVITQVYGSTLREVEKPVIPMIAGICAVFVNLFFNYLLIFGRFGFPKLGVSGAAIATVLSRFIECLITVTVAHVKSGTLTFIKGIYRNFSINMQMLRIVMPKALPLLANEFFWSLGIALMNNCYAMRGLDVVAAANITSTISNIFNISLIAFGSAISIIVGGLLGAGKREEAIESNIKLTFFSFILSVLLSVVLIFTAGLYPEMYNTGETVKQIAKSFIICYAFYLPLHAVMHAFYFALRSGGKTIVTFLFDSAYMMLISVPFTYVIAKYSSLGVVAVYALSLAIEIFKVIIGFVLISRGKWAQNIVGDRKS